MSYQRPPADQAGATFQGAEIYARPAVDQADATFQTSGSAEIIPGDLVVATQPPPVPFSAAISEQPTRAADSLWAKPPHQDPPPATASAQGGVDATASAAIQTGPTITTPILRAMERGYEASAEIQTSPAAYIAAPTTSATGDQTLDLPDNQGPSISEKAARALRVARGESIRQAQGERIVRRTGARHASAEAMPAGITYPHADMESLVRGAAARHAEADHASGGIEIRQAEMDRMRTAASVRSAEAGKAVTGAWARHADTTKRHTGLGAGHADALQTANRITYRLMDAKALANAIAYRSAEAIPPPPGRWWPFYEVPPLTLTIPCEAADARPLGCEILLSWEEVQQPPCGDTEPPKEPKRITAGRILVVTHSLEIYRTSDGAPIDASDFSVSIDMDSWAWGWNATLLTDEAYDLIQPDANGPQELTIILDGQKFRVLAEENTEDRKGVSKPGRKVSGRGIAAILSAPYSPPRSRTAQLTRTANQLADEELANTGWALTWETIDWTVPGDVYSYAAKTPMQSINEIANTAGAFVLPDPDSEMLRVRSRYPVSPWDWDTATPDYVIDANPIKSISKRWNQRPAYNKAWAAGKHGGVIVDVTRQGTAGDYAAPQVVHPLITDQAVGRERGRVEISAGGKWQEVSLTIPYLDGANGPGLVLPGSLVHVNDPKGEWRGIVQGTDIKGTLTAAEQTLQIDRRMAG